jgi:hypothetical protein
MPPFCVISSDLPPAALIHWVWPTSAAVIAAAAAVHLMFLHPVFLCVKAFHSSM